jgi:ribulose-phosphate 3-epimerase
MSITPSILTDSLQVAQEQIDRIAKQSPFTRIQIDIVDPEFADSITIHPIDVQSLNLHGVSVDVHLMTNDPINDVVECSQIPGINTIIAQIEHMPDQKAYLEHVKSYRIHAGFSLDFYTPVESIDSSLFSEIDIVQIMSNRAGRQGQEFRSVPTLEKIKELARIKAQHKYQFDIFVDIGMNPDTIALCAKAGATGFAPGSFLWKAPDFQRAVEAVAMIS